VAFFNAADGIALAVYDENVPSPRARIVIVHGYAEYSGRYNEVVRDLAASNFECHLFDLRGHGHSGGVPAHVSRFGLYVEDTRAAVERVQSLASAPAPLIIVAHSLGGLIALELVRQYPKICDAIAVSSPFLGPAFHIPLHRKLIARVASRIAPALPFRNEINPKAVSTDPEVVAAYASDPLIRRTTTPRWFTEVAKAQRTLLQLAAEIHAPLLMLLGTDDRLADHHLGKRLFDDVSSSDKTIKVYSGFRHEVFNESQRDLVISDLLGWLRAHS
jgi:alpha-beta hydrolase superfamily lysophospholipase